MSENQQQKTKSNSDSDNDFNVSDEFLQKSGLPRLDQDFLDDYVARQPWKTLKYRFFYFFRRWCMTILALTIFCPNIATLDKSTIFEGTFFTWIGLAVVMFAIVMDSYFVSKAPDQKLRIIDIYNYFYDDKYEQYETRLNDDFRRYKRILLKQLIGLSVFIFLISCVCFLFGIEPITLNFIVWGCAGFTGWLVLYYWPYDFALQFDCRKSWWPDIAEFLKYNRVFGSFKLVIFFAPFFLGPILYLLHLVGITYLIHAFYLHDSQYISSAQYLDAFHYFLKPLMLYFLLLIPIFFVFISIIMTMGIRFVSFAEEISQFKIDQE